MLNILSKNLKSQSPSTQSPSNQSISLVITILIISSILVSTITVGDVIIRHSKTVKSSELSENAYFAAESALEKANYEILKNYEDISSYTLSGSMTNGGTYQITDISLDDRSSFEVTLDAGESFEMALDFDGTNIYPPNVNVAQDGPVSTDLMIHECITDGTPRVCDSGYVQVFKSLLPHNFNIDEENKYYKIRINNLDVSSPETYTLTPSSGNLPVGVEITSKGIYEGYERQAESSFPKSQIFGID